MNITEQNQPAPETMIEVADNPHFEGFIVAKFFAVMRHIEDLDAAEIRLGTQHPEVKDLLRWETVLVFVPETREIKDFRYGRTIEGQEAPVVIGEPVVDPQPEEPSEGPSKAQQLGLLLQLKNLISNGQDTAKAMRSVADLYSKSEEVIAELDAITVLIKIQ